MEATAPVLDRQAFAEEPSAVPDLTKVDLRGAIRALGIYGAEADFLREVCWLAQRTGYCWAHQDELAERVGRCVRTIGSYARRLHDRGLIDVVATRHGNRYFPRWAELGFFSRPRVADDIRKTCRSLSLDGQGDKAHSPSARVVPLPTGPREKRAPLPRIELPPVLREQLVELPAGEEALRLLGGGWFRKEPRLALQAVHEVLHQHAEREPVMNAAGLLVTVYRRMLAAEETRLLEREASAEIGEWQRRPGAPVRRTEPPPCLLTPEEYQAMARENERRKPLSETARAFMANLPPPPGLRLVRPPPPTPENDTAPLENPFARFIPPPDD